MEILRKEEEAEVVAVETVEVLDQCQAVLKAEVIESQSRVESLSTTMTLSQDWTEDSLFDNKRLTRVDNLDLPLIEMPVKLSYSLFLVIKNLYSLLYF